MTYKTAITPKDGGYIGQILFGDDVIYTSPLLPDPIMVSRNLSTEFANIAQRDQPINAPTPQNVSSVSEVSPEQTIIPGNRPTEVLGGISIPRVPINPAPSIAPVRRCCGRG